MVRGVAETAESSREELKEFDQLTVEKNKGNVFVGLHEGEFWKFKCSYKYKVGEVDQYRLVFMFHFVQGDWLTEQFQCTTGTVVDRQGSLRDI